MLLLLKRAGLVGCVGLITWCYSTAVFKNKTFLTAPDFSDGAWLVKQNFYKIIPVPTIAQINRPRSKKTSYFKPEAVPVPPEINPLRTSEAPLPSTVVPTSKSVSNTSIQKLDPSCDRTQTVQSQELYPVLVRLKMLTSMPLDKEELINYLGQPACIKKNRNQEKLTFLPTDTNWQLVVYTNKNKITGYERH